MMTRYASDKCDGMPCRENCAKTVDHCEHGRYESLTHGKNGLGAEFVCFREEFLAIIPPGAEHLAFDAELAAVATKCVENLWANLNNNSDGTTISVVGTGNLGCNLVALIDAKIGDDNNHNFEIHCYDIYSTKKSAKVRFCEAVDGTTFFDLSTVTLEPNTSDGIIEAAGDPTLLEEMVMHLKPNGVLALMGFSEDSSSKAWLSAEAWDRIVSKNIKIFGSVNFSIDHLNKGLELIRDFDSKRKGLFENTFITARFPYTEVKEALVLASQPEALKVILEFPG